MIDKDGLEVEGCFVCTTCKADDVVHTDNGDAMPPGWLIVLDDWDAVVEVFCSQRCLASWASRGVAV